MATPGGQWNATACMLSLQHYCNRAGGNCHGEKAARSFADRPLHYELIHHVSKHDASNDGDSLSPLPPSVPLLGVCAQALWALLIFARPLRRDDLSLFRGGCQCSKFWGTNDLGSLVAFPPYLNTLTPESRTAFGQPLRIFNFNEPGLLHRP